MRMTAGASGLMSTLNWFVRSNPLSSPRYTSTKTTSGCRFRDRAQCFDGGAHHTDDVEALIREKFSSRVQEFDVVVNDQATDHNSRSMTGARP